MWEIPNLHHRPVEMVLGPTFLVSTTICIKQDVIIIITSSLKMHTQFWLSNVVERPRRTWKKSFTFNCWSCNRSIIIFFFSFHGLDLLAWSKYEWILKLWIFIHLTWLWGRICSLQSLYLPAQHNTQKCRYPHIKSQAGFKYEIPVLEQSYHYLMVTIFVCYLSFLLVHSLKTLIISLITISS